MLDGTDRCNSQFIRRLPVVLTTAAMAVLLTSCVTEKTGGFDKQPDEVIVQNYLQVARGYLQANDFAKVRQALATVAEYEPNNSEMYGIWGLVYAQEGDLDVADDNFRRALRLDRNNSLTRNNYAAFLFSNGKFEQAYEQLEIVVRDTEYEGRPQAFENLGLTALRTNRRDEAYAAFNRALQLNPNMVLSLTELIDLALVQQDPAQARRYFNSILTLQQFYGLGNTPRNLLQGIRLARLEGNGPVASQFATTLAETFPNSAEYRIYRQSILNE